MRNVQMNLWQVAACFNHVNLTNILISLKILTSNSTRCLFQMLVFIVTFIMVWFGWSLYKHTIVLLYISAFYLRHLYEKLFPYHSFKNKSISSEKSLAVSIGPANWRQTNKKLISFLTESSWMFSHLWNFSLMKL